MCKNNQYLYTRREMLKGTSCGMGYLAFLSLCAESLGATVTTAKPATRPAVDDINPLAPKPPHFPAKATRVIFLFMQGAPSHVDTFDYKPKLNAADGTTLQGKGNLLGSPWKFKQYGKSGLWISDLFPNLGQDHADDLCIVNSMYTDNPAHPQATIQMHTGSVQFVRPSVGAWVVYGLGNVNQNLPGYVTINPPGGVGGAQNYGSAFLPAAFQGTRMDGNAGRSIPNILNRQLTSAQQRKQLDLVQAMNHDLLAKTGNDPQVEGMIDSFELGFRMQSAVPDVMDISKEKQETLALYGIDKDNSPNAAFGRQCLMARRLSEAGVRYVEVCHAGWDQHQQLRAKHGQNALETDKAIAGLLTDLKNRGMLNDTLVVWGGEFGRTPNAQNGDGRNHNAKGFSMWMAGGGIKGGINYGATDDYGFAAEKDKVHIHDLHATILNQLGLDHEKLTYNYAGRDFRLTDVKGHVVKEIVA